MSEEIEASPEEVANAFQDIASERESTSETGEAEAAAETEEAQAATETADSEESDEALAQESQEEQKPAGRSQKLQKLIDSKGGDEEKFAESIYNQMNSAAALARKVGELEERLTSITPQEEEAESPDVVDFQQELQAVDGQISGVQQRQNSILIELGKVEHQISFLRGKIEKADEYDKFSLTQERFQLEQAARQLERDYKDLEAALPRLARDKKMLHRQLDVARQQVEASKANRRQRAIEERQYQETFRNRFETKVQELSKQYNVPTNSTEFLMDLTKAKASVFLRNLPENSAGLDRDEDLTTFVEAVVSKYAEDRNLGKKAAFTQLSKNKLATATKPPAVKIPQVTVEPPKTTKEARSAEFWRQRASKILGA